MFGLTIDKADCEYPPDCEVISMNRRFPTILLLLAICFCIGGCASKSVLIQGTLGRGILYDGKMYWETKTTDISKHGTEIGRVKKAAGKGLLPKTDFTVTHSAESYVGASVWKKEETLYLDVGEECHVFEYLAEMDLGEEVPLKKDADAEGMAAPHLVYQNMRYLMKEELSVNQIPDSFQKAGEIKEVCTIAARNDTGNLEVGTEFYSSKNQNRYLIVKYQDESFGVFENEAYENPSANSD